MIEPICAVSAVKRQSIMVGAKTTEDKEKMVLFHIAAIGWISPQTGYQNTR